jgi:cell division protein FtsB
MLEKENDALRKRVAELEEQVKALEAALAARKRRTTKKVEDK